MAKEEVKEEAKLMNEKMNINDYIEDGDLNDEDKRTLEEIIKENSQSVWRIAVISFVFGKNSK